VKGFGLKDTGVGFGFRVQGSWCRAQGLEFTGVWVELSFDFGADGEALRLTEGAVWRGVESAAQRDGTRISVQVHGRSTHALAPARQNLPRSRRQSDGGGRRKWFWGFGLLFVFPLLCKSFSSRSYYFAFRILRPRRRFGGMARHGGEGVAAGSTRGIITAGD
jgi:hypothetical protein